MLRRQQPQQQPLVRPIERVTLTRREVEALRRKSDDYHSRHRAGWDPLELRLALRAQFRRNRPGYAISNPGHDALLTRVGADLDDSMPGLAWLRSIYGRHAMLCTLPGVREHLRDRWERAWSPLVAARRAIKVEKPQGDLFDGMEQLP